jgi:excisionase family DNA binding protein
LIIERKTGKKGTQAMEKLRKDLLTTTEAGAVLGVKPYTVTSYVVRGYIRAERAGRDWLIPLAEVERYQAQRRTYRRKK